MNWKFEKEFRAAHPETIGEEDKGFDLYNYNGWLEQQLVNKNDLLHRVTMNKINNEKYYWVKFKGKWEMARWNEYFGMWHLFNDDWVPNDNITKVIEVNEPK